MNKSVKKCIYCGVLLIAGDNWHKSNVKVRNVCIVCFRKAKRISAKLRNKQNPRHTISLALNSAKKRAEKRNMEFSVTTDELLALWDTIDEKCEYCRIKMTWGQGNQGGITALTSLSIDRFNPKMGYTSANIVLCCHQCNSAKMHGTYEDLKNLAQRIMKCSLR